MTVALHHGNVDESMLRTQWQSRCRPSLPCRPDSSVRVGRAKKSRMRVGAVEYTKTSRSSLATVARAVSL